MWIRFWDCNDRPVLNSEVSIFCPSPVRWR